MEFRPSCIWAPHAAEGLQCRQPVVALLVGRQQRLGAEATQVSGVAFGTLARVPFGNKTRRAISAAFSMLFSFRQVSMEGPGRPLQR